MNQIDAITSIKNLGITYSQTSKRFVNISSGIFVSQNSTLGIIQKGIDKNRETLQILASDYSNGKIEIDSFALKSAQIIKDLHIYNTAIAKNGRLDLLTPSELKILNQRVNQQLTSTVGFEGEKYGVLELVANLMQGNISEAMLQNRLDMFANSAEQTQEYIKLESNKIDPTITEAMRILQSGKSCSDCVEFASLNWVSISDLIMPGENCQCRANCKCSVIYR